MKLLLKRMYFKSNYTIGKLFVNGEYFCDTLEDRVRKEKIAGKTAIDRGHYKIILNHSIRFERIMPLLLNVPEFEGIRIHPGNTDKDTSGCILVGLNKMKGRLLDSRSVFDNLMYKFKESHTPHTITIL